MNHWAWDLGCSMESLTLQWPIMQLYEPSWSGVGRVKIVYWPNDMVDTLSHNPALGGSDGHLELGVQMAQGIILVLGIWYWKSSWKQNQLNVQQIVNSLYSRGRILSCRSYIITSKSKCYQCKQGGSKDCGSCDDALCCLGWHPLFCGQQKWQWKWAAVPTHVRNGILWKSHGGVVSGNFSEQQAIQCTRMLYSIVGIVLSVR